MKKGYKYLALACVYCFLGLNKAEAAEGDIGTMGKAVFSDSAEFVPKDRFYPGEDMIYVEVTSSESNKQVNQIDSINVKLVSAGGADTENVILTETGRDTGVFRTTRGMRFLAEDELLGDGIIQVSSGEDEVTAIHLVPSGGSRVIGTVVSEASIDHYSVMTDPVQVAGKPFRVDITARDEYESILTDFSGGVSLVMVDTSGKEKPLRKVSSFSKGTARVFIAYQDAGEMVLAAKDDSGRYGESDVITFLPAKFKVDLEKEQTIGKEFEIKVSALNYKDEITPGYNGETILEPLYAGEEPRVELVFDSGEALVKITRDNYGEEKFIVREKMYPDIYGISESVFFNPHAFEVEIVPPPGKRDKYYIEELFKAKITALDYNGLEITGYDGVMEFETVEGVDMRSKYDFDPRNQGSAEFHISVVTEKPFKIKGWDTRAPGALAESEEIDVIQARVMMELEWIKGETAKMRVKIVDKNGKILTDDDSTVISFYLMESDPDGSASIPGKEKITVKNGQASILLTDTKGETVTVFPESEPYLEVVPAEVKFE